MPLALDLVILALLAWVLLTVAWLRSERRRALRTAHWQPRVRALAEGGHVVEIVCAGEPAQQVRRLPGDLGSEALGDELAEAVSEAEARAAALNAMRRPAA